MLISCGIAAGGNPSKCFDFKAESDDFFEKKNSDLPWYKTKHHLKYLKHIQEN